MNIWMLCCMRTRQPLNCATKSLKLKATTVNVVSLHSLVFVEIEARTIRIVKAIRK